MRRAGFLTSLLLLCLLTACATQPRVNPGFPVALDEARADLRRMEAGPKPLERPLVVLGGWMDPGFAAADLRTKFRRGTGDTRIAGVSFNAAASMDDCRRRVIETVERRFPSDSDAWTAEVDVVAFSMGGLIARYAAAGPTGATGAVRLNIHRLFTISTPHRGARLASMPRVNAQMEDMRAGSEFLGTLDAALRDATYTIISYGRAGDRIVGLENSAPPGHEIRWVPNPPMTPAHGTAFRDPRILADILRQLRGEEQHAPEIQIKTSPASFPN